MKTWADFLPRMVDHLPGCPEFSMLEAVRDAAIEFFERTRVWKRENVTLATTVAGQGTYFLDIDDLPEGAALTHLHAAWVGTEPVTIGRRAGRTDVAPGEQDALARAELRISGRADVTLSPAPETSGDVIKATVSFVPTQVSDGIDDELFYLYREAIEKRAIAELQSQEDKPWTSAKAVGHGQRYERLQREAAEDAGPVGGQGRLRVRQWG